VATQEMEIIVTAKVEKASKEFQKLVPTIKQITNQIQQAFSKIDTQNITQNLAYTFNNLLIAINNVVQSDGFQNFLNLCSEKFSEISEKLSSVNWQPLIDSLVQIGTSVGSTALDILSRLIDIFKWIVEHPGIAEIILAIATAIGVVSTIVGVLSSVCSVLTAVNTALNASLLPLIAAIVGLTIIIAGIVYAIMNWDNVGKLLVAAWDWIKQKAIDIWNGIAEFFKNIWQGICNIATNIWNAITTAISNVINGIKTVITNVLNAISTIWNNIWTGISNVVKNVWNGIWGCIRGVINLILGGIEGFVNGVIRGVNILLSGISKVANAVGNLIGLPSINLQLSTISLPRLAKGGVLTKATAIIAGEYSGASSNPEIVTPQNIMEETFGRVMSKYNNNNNQQHLSIHYMGKEIFNDTIDYINEKTRRTGKCVIKVGG